MYSLLNIIVEDIVKEYQEDYLVDVNIKHNFMTGNSKNTDYILFIFHLRNLNILYHECQDVQRKI